MEVYIFQSHQAYNESRCMNAFPLMLVSLSVYLINISFTYFIESSAEARNAVPSVSKRSKPLSGEDDRLRALTSVKGGLKNFFFILLLTYRQTCSNIS